MVIRTGLLFIPSLDDEVARVLQDVLRTCGLGTVIVNRAQAGAQRNWVAEMLRRWCDEDEMDLVLTIGGAWPAPGHSEAESVPAATMDVLDRVVPGLAEVMRLQVAQQNRLAILHCGVAGIRGRTLLINLPWGATSARLCLEAIVDLIAPVIERLQNVDTGVEQQVDLLWTDAPIVDHRTGVETASPAQQHVTGARDADTHHQHSLDASEFAAFLERKTGKESPSQRQEK